MMPLCTTIMVSSPLACGWAFASEGLPCVAQRVWPMPMVLANGRSASCDARLLTLPGILTRHSAPRSNDRAFPALSAVDPTPAGRAVDLMLFLKTYRILHPVLPPGPVLVQVVIQRFAERLALDAHNPEANFHAPLLPAGLDIPPESLERLDELLQRGILKHPAAGVDHGHTALGIQ